MKFLIVLLLGALCVAAHENRTRYDGFKVFHVTPATMPQLELLKELENSDDLDFWRGVSGLDNSVDVMVKPQDQMIFVRSMKMAGMSVEVFIDDVQKKIDSEVVGSFARAGMTWTRYYDLQDINAWMDSVAASNPGKATVVIGGSTYEGRQIKGLKISYGPGRKAVVLEGGIHAREWISPATLTYLANEVLTSTDPDFQKIARSFDWYIFPVTNPDGFVYTHTNNRMWRKTRTPYGLCYGADPNRNWDAHWREQGASSLPCADTYAGTAPFSDKCTATLSSYLRTIGPQIEVYISFHSYSQLLMMPYGHTKQHLDNYDDTLAIGKKAIEALSKRYGTKYRVGNIAETIYPASGGSIDWVKQEFKTPIVYVYELRDLGQNGFILPPNQIIPNCLEVVDSFVAMFLEAEKRGYFKLQ